MTNTGTADNRRRNLKTTLFLWGPPAIIFIVILILSLTPGSMYPEHPEILSTAIHFLEFVILSFFLARALLAIREGNALASAMLTVLICGLIGLTTELLQFTVPQRMFDITDMVVDISGAFAGAFLYINILRIKGSAPPGAKSPPGTDDA